MQKRIKLFIVKFFFLSATYYLLSTVLSGCATVPTQGTMPTYTLNDTAYLSMGTLCDMKGLNCSYDTYTRTAILRKGAHKINLAVGEKMVLVDGQVQYLRHPVDMYQGMVVLPYRFKEQILDTLFVDESCPAIREKVVITQIKKVVIDAGHGGKDPGAIGRTGLREKDVNLDIAKRLSKLLRSQGVEVVMTRTSDRFIALSTRVEIANRSGADLFISIHSNANRVRSLNGLEVYYVSSSVNDSQRAIQAASNTVLSLDSSSFASRSTNLKAILWDMIYTNNRAESIELGRSICRKIDSNLDTRVIGVKGARYYVLKGINIPGVLVETGFLTNYNEERRLKNGYYRQEIADCIAQAVSSYSRELALAEVAK